MSSAGRAAYLGLDFDRLDVAAVLATLAARPADARFAYVVTPNVDHVVRLHRDAVDATAVWDAYRRAALCLCDSRVLARLAKFAGIALPVVPGSDLTRALFDTVLKPGDRIAVVGGDADTIAAIGALSPGVVIVQHIPPMGVRANPAALAEAVAFVVGARARFTFLAIGSPQQEVLADRIRQSGATGTGLCIGASIDFLTGRAARAPRWMQRAGLEWAFRLLSEPRRLWRRYLIDAPQIFLLALKASRPR